MATKSKRPQNPEIQHLSELQISEIPQIIWEFLVSETGQQETALQLPPKKLRDYAGDFLDSDEGRFYWPLSDFQQWQYEATHGDVKKWIGELMVRERKRREVAASTLTVDDRHTGSGKKKEKGKAPIEGPSAPQKKESPSASRARAGERVRGAATVEVPPKKDPVTPTKRAKSPTIVPDVPYEEPPQPRLSTPKRSIRPTEAAVLIAGENSQKSGQTPFR